MLSARNREAIMSRCRRAWDSRIVVADLSRRGSEAVAREAGKGWVSNAGVPAVGGSPIRVTERTRDRVTCVGACRAHSPYQRVTKRAALVLCRRGGIGRAAGRASKTTHQGGLRDSPGIARRLWDRVGVSVSCHMVNEAACGRDSESRRIRWREYRPPRSRVLVCHHEEPCRDRVMPLQLRRA